MHRKKFSREFKLEAVRMVRERVLGGIGGRRHKIMASDKGGDLL